MKTNQIDMLKNIVAPAVAEARAIVIEDGEGMKLAVDLLSRLNKFNDQIVGEKEKVTKPLNEALKAERGRWKPIETINEEAILIIREKMITYQTNETKRAREEEARIAARVGEGKGKLKVETAVRQIEGVKRADGQVVGDGGMVKFREDKILKITDISKIPDIFWVVDEKLLLETLKKGETVEGAELEIKMVPLNYR